MTSMAVIHFGFLYPSLVAMRRRTGKPNGSASNTYLSKETITHRSTCALLMWTMLAFSFAVAGKPKPLGRSLLIP